MDSVERILRLRDAPDWCANMRASVGTCEDDQAAALSFQLTPGVMKFLDSSRQDTREVLCKTGPIYMICIRNDGGVEYIAMQCEANVLKLYLKSGEIALYVHWVIYIDQPYERNKYRLHPFLDTAPLQEEPMNTRDCFCSLAGIREMSPLLINNFNLLSKDDVDLKAYGVSTDDEECVRFRNTLIKQVLNGSGL